MHTDLAQSERRTPVMPSSSDVPNAPQGASNPAAEQAGNVLSHRYDSIQVIYFSFRSICLKRYSSTSEVRKRYVRFFRTNDGFGTRPVRRFADYTLMCFPST